MQTLAKTFFLESEFGVEQDLPRAGSALENPFVFHSSAQELREMASRGLLEIIDEQRGAPEHGSLIQRLRFKRVQNPGFGAPEMR